MKGVLVLVVMTCALTARGQVLGGIFNQGATELKEYAKQIAALQLLIDRSETGYEIEETGLDSVGNITGAEYGLHQDYFGSLGVVKPAVAGMPELGEILAMEGELVRGFSAAMGRWRASGRLTASEMEVCAEVYAEVVAELGELEGELQAVVADGVLVMGDNNRVNRVRQLNREMVEEYHTVGEYVMSTDLIVLQRQSVSR